MHPVFFSIPTTKIGVLFALFVCTAPVKQVHATSHKDLGTLCQDIDDIQSKMRFVPWFVYDIKYTAKAVKTLLMTLCDTHWNKHPDTCIPPVKAMLEQLIPHNRIDDAKQRQQYVKQYTQPMEQSKQAITHSFDRCAQALKPLLTYLEHTNPAPHNRGASPSVVAKMLLQQWYTQCNNLCTTCEAFKTNNPVRNQINAMRHYIMGRKMIDRDIHHVDNPPQHRTSAPLPSDVDP